MPYQDLCHKYLDPSLWERSELRLLGRVRSALIPQLRSRFPKASAFWVVGELTTHFYGPDSTLDVLVTGPKVNLQEWEQEAEVVSDHRILSSSDRLITLVFVPQSVKPEVLASKFGPLYNIETSVWIGRRPGFGIFEIGTADNLLKRINWELFKLRKTNSQNDANLLGIKDSFTLLPSEDRSLVLHTLAERVNQFDSLLSEVLTNQPAATWRATDSLEQSLLEADSVGAFLSTLLEERPNVPISIQNIVFHKHRYNQVLTELRELAEQEHILRSKEEGPFGALPIEAQVTSMEKTSMTQAASTVFSILRIEGSSSSVRVAKAELLKNRVAISSSSPTSLCLSRVKEQDLPKLARFLEKLGTFTLVPLDPQKRAATPVVEAPEPEPRSLFLTPKKWYFADALEETYPFIFVKTPQSGQDSWEVELLTAANTIPVRKVLSSTELQKFSLRPATAEDFEARDLPQPEDRFLLTASFPIEESAQVEVAALEEWGERRAARSSKQIEKEISKLLEERDAAEEALFGSKHTKAQYRKLRKKVDVIQAKISKLGEELESSQD